MRFGVPALERLLRGEPIAVGYLSLDECRHYGIDHDPAFSPYYRLVDRARLLSSLEGELSKDELLALLFKVEKT